MQQPSVLQDFASEQTFLAETVRRINFFARTLNQKEYETLLYGKAPIDESLIMRFQKEVREAFVWDSSQPIPDEDRLQDLEDASGSLERMALWNAEIRKMIPASRRPRVALQPQRTTIVNPQPSAPETTLYPRLPPQSVVVAPEKPTPVFVPPVVLTTATFEFALPVRTPEEKGASESFLNELTKLRTMVKEHRDRFPDLARTFQPLISSIEPPVQYHGALFESVRTFLNRRISEIFSVAANEAQEESLGILDLLLAQTHTVMFQYYRIRRVFALTTVEEDEAKAKAQGQPPPKSGFLSYFKDEIHLDATDNQ